MPLTLEAEKNALGGHAPPPIEKITVLPMLMLTVYSCILIIILNNILRRVILFDRAWDRVRSTNAFLRFENHEKD